MALFAPFLRLNSSLLHLDVVGQAVWNHFKSPASQVAENVMKPGMHRADNRRLETLEKAEKVRSPILFGVFCILCIFGPIWNFVFPASGLSVTAITSHWLFSFAKECVRRKDISDDKRGNKVERGHTQAVFICHLHPGLISHILD